MLRRLAGLPRLVWGRTPLPRGRDSTPVERLRAAMAPALARALGVPPAAVTLLARVLWPLRAPWCAARATCRHARRAEALGAPAPARQFLAQLSLALLDEVEPLDYYALRLFEPGQRASARAFVANSQAAGLFAALNAAREDLLEDKLACAELLSGHGVRVAPTLAVARNGTASAPGGGRVPALPDADLIAKPNGGMQGEGVVRIDHVGDGRWRIGNATCDATGVLDQLCRWSREADYLLQPLLRNHPAIAALAPDSLSSVRLVTGLDPRGSCVPVAAVLKIPRPGAAADNFAAGGWAAPVAIDEGRVGAAVPKTPLVDAIERHPLSGAPIAGAVLPLWRDALELAAAAHAALPEFVFLGWDLALTAAGPLVLEVNGTWDARLMQVPGPSPLGLTAFTTIALAWLDRARA